MTHNEVGAQSVLPQRAADGCNRGAVVNGAVYFHRVGVAIDEPAIVLGIRDLGHAHHGIVVRLRDEIHAIAAFGRQLADDVAVLRREILVNEKIVHGPQPPSPERRAPSDFSGIQGGARVSAGAHDRREAGAVVEGIAPLEARFTLLGLGVPAAGFWAEASSSALARLIAVPWPLVSR